MLRQGGFQGPNRSEEARYLAPPQYKYSFSGQPKPNQQISSIKHLQPGHMYTMNNPLVVYSATILVLAFLQGPEAFFKPHVLMVRNTLSYRFLALDGSTVVATLSQNSPSRFTFTHNCTHHWMFLYFYHFLQVT